jgi:probable rRNA maturation factor
MISSISSNLTVIVNIQDFLGENKPELAREISAEYPITEKTWEDWFETWLKQLYPNAIASDAYELSLRLTDDQEIQFFNSQYRHKNQPTDILAFAALEGNLPQPSTEEPLYLGDLVISVETALKQAQEQRHSLKIELAWLASHGLLHLLGWDHPDAESLEIMLSQQKVLLETIKFE